MDIPYAPPPLFFFFRKSKAVSLSSRTTCKNSNHALNVLQFKSPPTFFQLLHSISNPGVFPAGVGSQPHRGPFFSAHYRSWKRSVCVAAFMYRPAVGVTSESSSRFTHNMFWMVLKCVLAIVPIKAHVKYMREFHGWSGRWWWWWWEGGAGADLQGSENTCYILPLQTLISVFISFLCNLFSFMVELTQVSRVQWFNTHVSFTCLVKCSKALPLSKMSVSLASLTNKRRGGSFDSYL